MSQTDNVVSKLRSATVKYLEKKAKTKSEQQKKDEETASQIAQTSSQSNQNKGTTAAVEKLNTIKPAEKTSYTTNDGFIQGSAFQKSLKGNTSTTTTDKPASQVLKEAIDNKTRQTGFQKLKTTVKDLGKAVYQIGKHLVSEYVTNTDKEKGILDYDKYQQYQDQLLSDSTTDDQRSAIYDKMIKEGVIDQNKYSKRRDDQVEEQSKNINAEIQRVSEAQKEDFRNELKEVLKPYVKETNNHYQMDALSKATDRMMKQYELTYDNVVETYDDTRDENIINTWEREGTVMREGIKKFLGLWGDYISQGYTDNDAYRAVIENNAGLADSIVNAENRIKNAQYKATINANFSKEGNVGGTTLSQLGNYGLGLLNTMQFWTDKYLSQPLEELKQTTSYYDIVEELANLNINDETDGWFKKGYRTVGSWLRSLYDAAPTLLPTVAGILLTKKVGLPDKLGTTGDMAEEIINGRKVIFSGTRGGFKQFVGHAVGNLVEDYMVLDWTTGVTMGRPTTREDMMFNLFTNGITDSFIAWKSVKPIKEYLAELPRGAIIKDVVKKELVDKVLTMKDPGKIAEFIHNYTSLDIINGTEDVGKKINLNDLAKTDPDAYNKFRLGQQLATEIEEGLKTGDTSAKNLAALYIRDLREAQAKAADKINQRRKQANDIVNDIRGVQKRTAAALGKGTLDVTQEVIEEADMLTKFLKLDNSTDTKLIHGTVKTIVSKGYITDDQLVKIVSDATSGLGKTRQGTFNLIYGLLKGGKDGNELVSKGYAELKQIGQDGVTSSVNSAYQNVFEEVLKMIGNSLQEGDMIGSYIKTGNGKFRNIFNGTTQTLEELLKGLHKIDDSRGNSTIKNIQSTAKGIANDLYNVGLGEDKAEVYPSKYKNGRDTYVLGGTIWQKGFHGKNERSILMNKYFLEDFIPGTYERAGEGRLGGRTAEEIYKDQGLQRIIKDKFKEINFDFVVKEEEVGGETVYRMYIWSRNEANANKFKDTLLELSQKKNFKSLTKDEYNTFIASHIGEYIKTHDEYKKVAQGINNAKVGDEWSKNFKIWFEGLYTESKGKYILKKNGTVAQLDRLNSAIKNNASLKEVETAAAANDVSGTVDDIISNGFSPTSEKRATNKVLNQPKIPKGVQGYEIIKNELKKVFVKHYDNPVLYERIINQLATFMQTFYTKEEGLTLGMVQALGDMYAQIITSPETLSFLSRMNDKFFTVLTAKLINNGIETNANSVNQAFAKYLQALSDVIYERGGDPKMLGELLGGTKLNGGDHFKLPELLDNINWLINEEGRAWDVKNRGMRGEGRDALYIALDNKAINTYIDGLNIIDKTQRDLFFKEESRLKYNKYNTKGTVRKAKKISEMTKPEIQDMVDYVTWRELKAAGLYDYNLLVKMREGLTDMITNGALIDKDLKLSLDANYDIAFLRGRKTKENILNLSYVYLPRLWLYGSQVSTVYKEAIMHELTHVEDITALNKSLYDYIKLINSRIANMNPSDRKEIASKISYMVTGESDLWRLIDRLETLTDDKSIGQMAEYIWNQSEVEGQFRTVDRYRITSHFWNVLSDIEEIVTEAHIINSVLGGTKELPINLGTAIEKAIAYCNKYRKVINTLENGSFETLDEFKRVLYTDTSNTKFINTSEGGWETKELEDFGENISNSYIKNSYNDDMSNLWGDDLIRDEVFNNEEEYYNRAKREGTRLTKSLNEETLNSIISNSRETKGGLAILKAAVNQVINKNALVIKGLEDLDSTFMEGVVKGIGNKQPKTETQLGLEKIIEYSLIGKNSAPKKGNFLDQIRKSYIDKQPFDLWFKYQGGVINMLKKNGMRENKDIPIFGWFANKQSLPMIDSKIGTIVSKWLDEFIFRKEPYTTKKIDASSLLVGEDVMNKYYDYLKTKAIPLESIKDGGGGLIYNGEFYKSFDNFVAKNGHIVTTDLIEEWNKAVIDNMNVDDELIETYLATPIMPLQTFVISRHVINTLSAIGEYSGIGDKNIKELNDTIRTSCRDKAFAELSTKKNYQPITEILNDCVKTGIITEEEKIDILAILGSHEGDTLNNLIIKLTPGDSDPIPVRLEKIKTALNIEEEAIEDINKSLYNSYVYRTKSGEGSEEQFAKTAGLLYQRIIGLADDMKYMAEHEGKAPDNIRTIRMSKDESVDSVDEAINDIISGDELENMKNNNLADSSSSFDFDDDVVDDIESLNGYGEALGTIQGIMETYLNKLTDRYMLTDDNSWFVDSLGNTLKETKPYNINSNFSIQLGQFIDMVNIGKADETRERMLRLIDGYKDRQTKNQPAKHTPSIETITKNAKDIVNNIPVSDHVDYLNAYGVAKTVADGKFNDVSIVFKTKDGGEELTYSLSTPSILNQNKGLDMLDNLLEAYQNKETIGAILTYHTKEFRKEPKDANEIYKGVSQLDHVSINYNNIFSSFIGRDIAKKLGVEKEFLENQSNFGALQVIGQKLYNLSITGNKELKDRVSGLINKINKILGADYKEGKTFSDKIRGAERLNMIWNHSKHKGAYTNIKLDSYIPTFSIEKIEGEYLDDMGNVIDRKMSSYETRPSDTWISGQYEFDKYQEELLMSYAGENVSVNHIDEITFGRTPVRGTNISPDGKASTVYGIIKFDEYGNNSFLPYNRAYDYLGMYNRGEINGEQYDAIITLGNQIYKTNLEKGVYDSIKSASDTKEGKRLVSRLNDVNRKITELEIKSQEAAKLLTKNEIDNEINNLRLDMLDLCTDIKYEAKGLETDVRDAINKSYLDESLNEDYISNRFTKDETLDIAPTKAIDNKAKVKGSIANKFIGYADGLEGSSTAEYAKQAGDKANVGKYEKGDVVFVSVPGKRGDYKIRHEQQNRTIKEAMKALDEGAIIIADSKSYLEKSSYNEGEKRLAKNLEAKGYIYKDIIINGTTIGSWIKLDNNLENSYIARQFTNDNINPYVGLSAEYKRLDELSEVILSKLDKEKELLIKQKELLEQGGQYDDSLDLELDELHREIQTLTFELDVTYLKIYKSLREKLDNAKNLLGDRYYEVRNFVKPVDDILDDMEPDGKSIDDVLDSMNDDEVQEFHNKVAGADVEGAVKILKGTNSIPKSEIDALLGEEIYTVDSSIDRLEKFAKGDIDEFVPRGNTILGADGKYYDPQSIEGVEALNNGGTDISILFDEDVGVEALTKDQSNKIATSLFSFGNYDIIQASDTLTAIAGHRAHFMDNNKDELQEAIKEFNLVTKDLSQEEKEELYKRIIAVGRMTIGKNQNDLFSEAGLKRFLSNRCEVEVSDNEEINAAIQKIGNVFAHITIGNDGKIIYDPNNPAWSWAHQFATLNTKGGFDDLWMRLNSNQFSASVDYLLHQNVSIINGKDLRRYIKGLAEQTGASEGKVDRFVKDWFGDSLGTSALYKMDANAKSLYRMFKYSPLAPISGTLMLVQSTLLGIAMYFSKKVGLGSLMDLPEFDILTLKKGEKLKINGVEYEGLGWLSGSTRQGDISLNSNTDLGRTLVDKTLDSILGIIPMPQAMRDTLQSVMKGGLQSIWDIASQSSVKNMSLAQSLASNGIVTAGQLKNFIKAVSEGKIPSNKIAKILGDAEVNYSRFFSNSATTVMSRNRFSRRWLFNCMNNYTILRSDEVIQGVMKFRKDLRDGVFNDMTFSEYMLERNPELKGLMNNILMGIKMGYHFNLMANGDNDNQENLEKYIVDSSDYLSSIPATFFYNILSAPFKGVSDYIDYTNAVGESETFGGAAKAATLNTLSKTMSQFFREGKVLNVLRDWLISYSKTGDLDYASTVAGVDLEKIANGLGRFMLVEGTETYGSTSLSERGDPIGQILLNSFETNKYGKAKTKLNNIVTAEEYVNGDTHDQIINILAYMPVLGEFIKNATTGQGFTFTEAKYRELENMVDNSEVIQNLYRGKINTDDFTDASINRLYSELIKFDYTANRTLGKDGEYKLGSYDNKTGKDITLNDMKEAVFTKNMLDKLGLSREEFVEMLNKADDSGDAKALTKIIAMAQAAEPGSSRVCLSYLANKYHYDLMKEYSGEKYPSGNDVTEEQANEINRKVVQKYYPLMFVVDKTSLYKAVREYISIANPTIFDTLYKDDDLSGYVNSLGYLDMLMFQFAHEEGDVDARYIKNAFSLIGKYVPNTEARVSIMNHTMQTIEDLDTYDSIKTMMKMGVIAGNTDIYDKIKKDELMQIMNKDLLETYENFVWGVNEEINQKGSELAQKELNGEAKKQYKGIYGKNFRYSKYANGNSKTQDDVQKEAQRIFSIGETPNSRLKTVPYTKTSFTPYKQSPLYFYIKIYEDTIKETSDKLVTTTGKKYPAQTIEGMTYHGKGSNKGRIKAKKLEFPTKTRRARSYSTDRWAGYPGG